MPRVLNRERLQKKLASLPVIMKRRIKEPMEKGAQDIVDLAYHLCPVQSGALRNSIDWTWGDPPAGAVLRNFKRRPDDGPNQFAISVYAGNELAFYARWVEFGTGPGTKGGRTTNKSGRARKVNRTHPGTPAQPFFYPAYRALKASAKSKIKAGVNRALKEAASL